MGDSSPGCAPPKYGVGLRRWENQRSLSSIIAIMITMTCDMQPGVYSWP